MNEKIRSEIRPPVCSAGGDDPAARRRRANTRADSTPRRGHPAQTDAGAFRRLDIEAYPDPSPPLVEIIAQQPGWSAEEMERQITLPLETQLNGMAGLDHLRSISLFGLTDIKCYFKYETDYNSDRQEVINRLQMVTLPAGVQPALSPQSATGEIYRYELRNEGASLMDLKTAQDWVLKRQFKQVPGVIDVVSFGGQTKQFHVELDPNKLIQFNVSVPQVMQEVSNSNANVGANYLELGAQSYNVRGIGLFRNEEDIGDVKAAERNGTPIYVKQLGEVSAGAKTPIGRVGRDYTPDIAQGVVLMRRNPAGKDACAPRKFAMSHSMTFSRKHGKLPVRHTFVDGDFDDRFFAEYNYDCTKAL